MDRYLNLELVQNDASANAPERDYFMDALEVCRQSDASEASLLFINHDKSDCHMSPGCVQFRTAGGILKNSSDTG